MEWNGKWGAIKFCSWDCFALASVMASTVTHFMLVMLNNAIKEVHPNKILCLPMLHVTFLFVEYFGVHSLMLPSYGSK